MSKAREVLEAAKNMTIKAQNWIGNKLDIRYDDKKGLLWLSGETDPYKFKFSKDKTSVKVFHKDFGKHAIAGAFYIEREDEWDAYEGDKPSNVLHRMDKNLYIAVAQVLSNL